MSRYIVTTTNFQCPRCGQVYDYVAHSSHFMKVGEVNWDVDHYLRSPFVICKNCGTKFVDKRYKEWINMSPEERDFYYEKIYRSYGLLGGIIPFTICDIIFIIALISTAEAMCLIPIIVFSILLIVFISKLVRKTNIYKNHLYDEKISESLQRSTNVEYLQDLLDIGLDLYYLDDDSLIAKKINKMIDEELEE